VRREANPEPEPESAQFGSRCPICLEKWDVNEATAIRSCCCRAVCISCMDKTKGVPCPLCRAPYPTPAETLVRIRRHVENDNDEAARFLGELYDTGGRLGVVNRRRRPRKFTSAPWSSGTRLRWYVLLFCTTLETASS
jgi:hypothetical protein